MNYFAREEKLFHISWPDQKNPPGGRVTVSVSKSTINIGFLQSKCRGFATNPKAQVRNKNPKLEFAENGKERTI